MHTPRGRSDLAEEVLPVENRGPGRRRWPLVAIPAAAAAIAVAAGMTLSGGDPIEARAVAEKVEPPEEQARQERGTSGMANGTGAGAQTLGEIDVHEDVEGYEEAPDEAMLHAGNAKACRAFGFATDRYGELLERHATDPMGGLLGSAVPTVLGFTVGLALEAQPTGEIGYAVDRWARAVRGMDPRGSVGSAEARELADSAAAGMSACNEAGVVTY